MAHAIGFILFYDFTKEILIKMNVFLTISMFMLSIIITLLSIAMAIQLPLLDIIPALTTRSFIYGHNFCGITHHDLFYLIFFPVALITILLKKLQFSPFKMIELSQILSTLLISLFSLFILFHTIDQERYRQSHQKLFADKTMEEKAGQIFGDDYWFAQFCAQRVQGRHRGLLITDYNLNETLEPYTLGYYLYPAIDLFVDKTRPIDYAVILNKPNPLDNIPQGYILLEQYNQFCALAKRQTLTER